MPSNLSRRTKLLAVALLALMLAHGATPLANPRVRALGELLQCLCGCEASITGCNMLNCHFSDPVREKLLTMVGEGKSDKEILDAMVAQYGLKILRKPPAQGFYLSAWLMPLGAGLAGLLVVWLVIRMYFRRPAAATAAGSPDLERYRDQIEKDSEFYE